MTGVSGKSEIESFSKPNRVVLKAEIESFSKCPHIFEFVVGRRDSNLQPDRSERRTLPGKPSIISVSQSKSFTFVHGVSAG